MAVISKLNQCLDNIGTRIETILIHMPQDPNLDLSK